MIIFTKRYFRYFDWISFCFMLIIASIGLLFVYSATYTDIRPFSIFFKKQLFGILSGIALYIIFSITDYRNLSHWGFIGYFVITGLLAFTLIKGAIGMGAQRWINLFFFRLQPSELAKLFLPAFIMHHLYECNDAHYHLIDYLPILIMLCMNTLLVLKQPDLGTALLILFCGLILLWLAGLPKKLFLALAMIALLSAPIAWRYLKPYQKNRIAVFLGAGKSNKERYQLEQSEIAIGSGGFFGKGFLKGTQNRLMFLPEGRTDFIFAILCEEWGFIGGFGILLLYSLLFFRLLLIVYTINNFYAQLLAFGLMIHIVLATIINIGMVTGLLPIVGIPLPLMSYGICHTWITFASLGWINGISIRRYYFGE
jgi:rod shape determining protein RodA